MNGETYTLNPSGSDDNPELVKKVLRAIANKWPQSDWQFYADANKTITDVVVESAT